LWAQFELTSEEGTLMRSRPISEGYLTLEGSKRDFYRSLIFGFLGAIITVSLINYLAGLQPANPYPRQFAAPGLSTQATFLLFLFIFPLFTWLIYEQLREAIKVADLVNGREFKHRSLVLMARRERQILGLSEVLREFLEKIAQEEQTGAAPIVLGAEHAWAVSLVTDTHAAA